MFLFRYLVSALAAALVVYGINELSSGSGRDVVHGLVEVIVGILLVYIRVEYLQRD